MKSTIGVVIERTHGNGGGGPGCVGSRLLNAHTFIREGRDNGIGRGSNSDSQGGGRWVRDC